jgi:ABC-type transporter Mla maintaining outer membrane lipid asymmetry ATPase subunit MlaF
MTLNSHTDDALRIVPAIEFRDVTLAFDDQVVLDGVSFTVRRGETKDRSRRLGKR